ncbi:MAG: ATP-binding protein [Thermodesulfobacteriota bacterium]
MKAFLERHRAVVFALCGAIAGYCILSPLTMLLSDHVHKALTWKHFLVMHGDWRISVKEVFKFSFWPWAMVFTLWGLICGIILAVLEEKITRERREKAQIFEVAPDGMWLVDLEHNVLEANQGILSLLGLPSGIIEGRKCYEILPGPECRTEKCPLSLVRMGREQIEMEVERKRRNGIRFPCLLTAAPFKGRDGKVIGLIEDFRDISGYKKLEEELRQSQKVEAMGEIAGSVAHDFNNILVGIQGYADLGETKGSPHDPAYKYFGKIKEQAKMATDIAGQILAFSRQKPLAMQKLDLNALLSDFRDFLALSIGKGIALDTAFAPDLREIKGDPSALQQIILNLSLNARDAMPKGGKLVIETGNETIDALNNQRPPQAAPGDYVRLTISDTGRGMDEETQKRIFEPFFTTKELGKGTGLGMATVYRLVKQHGGLIDLTSQPGKGTTFTITLPVEGPKKERRKMTDSRA